MAFESATIDPVNHMRRYYVRRDGREASRALLGQFRNQAVKMQNFRETAPGRQDKVVGLRSRQAAAKLVDRSKRILWAISQVVVEEQRVGGKRADGLPVSE